MTDASDYLDQLTLYVEHGLRANMTDEQASDAMRRLIAVARAAVAWRSETDDNPYGNRVMDFDAALDALAPKEDAS